ncbi:MDR efflux pump AcrAB transcriptional activator MarA [Escherichia coli]|nr:MDR efflux pump AcrAB transcriptional activator MarA [Escherichia coli]
MKSTSDLFNEIIPLGRLIHMVNQKKDRLLNEYLSPLDITAAQFKVLCSIRCAACITPVELKRVLSVDLGALTRMLDRLVCKGWVERLPNPNDKRGVLVKLTTSGKKRGMTMSRRNTDAITIHSILDWIEDNLESPLSLEKVSERSGYSKWHLQRMFKKETGHSLGQYIRSRKMTEIAQKLKESNEPILYLAERYGFESQQTLTRTFKNYFDVPPHKYRMTNMQGESRFLHPLNHYNS